MDRNLVELASRSFSILRRNHDPVPPGACHGADATRTCGGRVPLHRGRSGCPVAVSVSFASHPFESIAELRQHIATSSCPPPKRSRSGIAVTVRPGRLVRLLQRHGAGLRQHGPGTSLADNESCSRSDRDGLQRPAAFAQGRRRRFPRFLRNRGHSVCGVPFSSAEVGSPSPAVTTGIWIESALVPPRGCSPTGHKDAARTDGSDRIRSPIPVFAQPELQGRVYGLEEIDPDNFLP